MNDKQAEWDHFFIEVCNTISMNSKCLSRKIGCVIVRDKSVISTGYNGPPRGVPPCDSIEYWQWLHHIRPETRAYKREVGICPRRKMGYKSGQGLHYCPAQHAERNAITNAAKLGVSVEGSTLYLNAGVPCKDCFGAIINAGIVEIVHCGQPYPSQSMWYDDISKYFNLPRNINLRMLEDYHATTGENEAPDNG